MARETLCPDCWSPDKTRLEYPCSVGNIHSWHNLPEKCEAASQPVEDTPTFAEHVKHVSRFLNEMYATMIDPVEQPHLKVKELCDLLLMAARQQRQALYDLSAGSHESSSTSTTTKSNGAGMEHQLTSSPMNAQIAAGSLKSEAASSVEDARPKPIPIENTAFLDNGSATLGQDELLAESSVEDTRPVNVCPSCGATDNNPYVDAAGVHMRACLRCMIQWRVAFPVAALSLVEDSAPTAKERTLLIDRMAIDAELIRLEAELVRAKDALHRNEFTIAEYQRSVNIWASRAAKAERLLSEARSREGE